MPVGLPEPRALPKESDVSFDADGLSSWKILLAAEQEALARTQAQPSSKYKNNLVAIRVLGFFMLDFKIRPFALGITPYNCLHLEVKSCLPLDGPADTLRPEFTNISELSLRYLNFLMQVFYSTTGPLLQTPVSHPSRPSFNDTKTRVLRQIQSTDITSMEIKELALFRDGYKCLLSGFYDRDSLRHYPEVAELFEQEMGLSGVTQCAYIFPETAQSIEKVIRQTFSGVLTFLARFGLEKEVKNLLGGRINSLANILTLQADLRIEFDRGNLWFEPVNDQPDTYDVVYDKYTNTHVRPFPDRVTFILNPDIVHACQQKGIQPPALPSRMLLATRAACSRVLHMSGAAEQINIILRDIEEVGVLAKDGSAADLLFSAISRAIPVD
ncbi:hypothetical protein BXZ70DRAFT_901214 [Cristinia sonorae]|uniref:HNH nuclease domain-containing protein n=1 Tax=Cristinia sonorae TaxID=1940300 RepID=A0A8K0UGX7_9AGAR|nr:hypothetical protein BXZ70DRAFT_901214 [Cristinia sonorae]